MESEALGFEFECPACGASVDYQEVVDVGEQGVGGCPECGHASPLSEWFGE